MMQERSSIFRADSPKFNEFQLKKNPISQIGEKVQSAINKKNKAAKGDQDRIKDAVIQDSLAGRAQDRATKSAKEQKSHEFSLGELTKQADFARSQHVRAQDKADAAAGRRRETRQKNAEAKQAAGTQAKTPAAKAPAKAPAKTAATPAKPSATRRASSSMSRAQQTTSQTTFNNTATSSAVKGMPGVRMPSLNSGITTKARTTTRLRRLP